MITEAFIGYLVAGLPGASLAAIGIFLPVFIPVAVLSPWFKRHRDNAQLKAFVQGATAAATGAITGSVVILGQRAISTVRRRRSDWSAWACCGVSSCTSQSSSRPPE